MGPEQKPLPPEATLSDAAPQISEDGKQRYWIVCPHPHCGKRVLVSPLLEGKAIRCPTCGRMMRVPIQRSPS